MGQLAINNMMETIDLGRLTMNDVRVILMKYKFGCMMPRITSY